jgi:hypothetical protein
MIDKGETSNDFSVSMRFQNDEHLTGVDHCDVQKLLADAIDAGKASIMMYSRTVMHWPTVGARAQLIA